MKRLSYKQPTFPFQFVVSPYFGLVWFVLLAVSYFFWDQSITNFVQTYKGLSLLKLWRSFSFLGLSIYYLIPLTILILVSKFILKNKKWTAIGCFLFLSIALPGLFCDILKPIFGRSRVSCYLVNDIYGFYGLSFGDAHYYSFPSGHATVIAGLALAGILLWTRWWIVFTLIMIVISFARILDQAHFLSDVLMGIYLGAFGAIKLYENFVRKGWLLNDNH